GIASAGFATDAPPTVSGGRVYVLGVFCCGGGQSSSALSQFDAAGKQGCAGVPTTCQPLGKAGTSSGGMSFARSPIAIAGGVAYAVDLGLSAFATNTLDKLWGAGRPAVFGTQVPVSPPSIANGVLYTVGIFVVSVSPQDYRLEPLAYDASGQTGCSGV